MVIRRMTKPILILGILILFVLLGTITKNVWLRHVGNVRNAQMIQIHESICDNLVQAEHIEREDCFSLSAPPDEYIPVYFPIGTTDKQMIRQGMDDVHVLYDGNTFSSCDDGTQASTLEYRLVEWIWNVSFGFCGDKLIAISYQD